MKRESGNEEGEWEWRGGVGVERESGSREGEWERREWLGS